VLVLNSLMLVVSPPSGVFLSIDIILPLQVRNTDPVFGPCVSSFLIPDLGFTLCSFSSFIPDILRG